MRKVRRILALAVGSAALTALFALAASSSTQPDLPNLSPQVSAAVLSSTPSVATGEVLVGNTASAPKSRLTFGSADPIKYQWFACDEAVTVPSKTLDPSCSPIVGEQSPDLVLSDEQVGKRVLFSMALGSGPVAFSAATEAAVSPAPTLSAAPVGPSKSVIFASATSTKLNSKITATRGAWPAPGVGYTFTNEWLRCSTASEASLEAPQGCSLITGATATTYTVTAKDHGFWLVSHMTASLAGVNTEIWTNSIGPVYKAIKYYKGASVAAGDGTYPYLLDKPVTANEGTWDGPPKFTYQWHVCSKAVPAATKLNALCKVITGATKDAFTPTAAQNGKYLMVRISGSTPLAKTIVTVFSASSGKVLDDPTNTKVLSIPATAPVVDDPTTVTIGVWTGSPAPVLSHDWFVCPTDENATDDQLPDGCEAIQGATSTSLVITKAMLGRYIIARETATSAAGTDSIISRTSPVVVSRPVYESDPVVLGVNEIGQTLTATTGVGENSLEDSVEYQWLSCATAGVSASVKPANCSLIAGADQAEFATTRSVEGAYIAVQVTLVNEVGRTVRVSATTSDFIKSEPVLESATFAPAVDPVVATPVTAPSGLWRGAPALKQTFQWFVCASEGAMAPTQPAGCSPISGAEAASFTPSHAQADNYLRVRVTATNSMGSYTVWSGTSSVVREKPNFIGVPVLSATALSGTPIELSETSSNGVPVPTRSIVWYQCKSAVNASAAVVPAAAGCVAIPGQVSASYIPTNADLDKYIGALVTSTNSIGSASVFTATSLQVRGAPKLLNLNTLAAPGVTGANPVVGTAVSAPSTVWVGAPAPAKLFQWYSCADRIATTLRDLSDVCSEINGQTGSSFVPTVQEEARFLMVRVGASNTVGSDFYYTSTSDMVLEAPNFTADPEITGGVLTGQSLSIENVFTRGSPVPDVTYSWYRCDSPVTVVQSTTTCRKITAATGTSYTLVAGDLDKYISGAVTLKSSLGEVTKISLSSAKIQGPPVLTGVLGGPSAAAIRVDVPITMPANVWTGSPAVTKTQQWFACSIERVQSAPTIGPDCAAIAGATAVTFTPTTAQVSKFLAVRIVATNTIATVTIFTPTTSAVNESPSFQGDVTLSEANLVGNTVTVTPPAVRGFPQPTATYGWYRCPVTVSWSATTIPLDCARINGADKATYELDSSDLDKFVVAGVRMENSSGAVVKYSPSTVAIQGVPKLTNTLGAPYSSLAAVTSPRIGTIQKAPTNIWAGSPKPNVSLQWVRCQDTSSQTSNVPVPCDDIPGATADSYTPVLADKTFALRVRITATNTLGTTTIWSSTTNRTQQAPTFGADPTLNSFVSVGTLLSVNQVSQVAYPTATPRYLWYRCSMQIATPSDALPATGCTLIDNETIGTHTILSTDVDSYLVAKVTLENAAGSVSRFTASTGKIISKPVFDQEPQVGGQSYVTGTLVINPFTVSAKPAATLSYQWYSCSLRILVNFGEVQEGCVAIAGATASSYSPTVDMAGKFVSVLVTASNLAGDVTSFSKTTSAILMPPRNEVAPVVTGVTKEGAQLQSDSGTWTPATNVLFTYTWYACNKATLAADAISSTECKIVAGATAKTLNLTAAQVGKYMVAAVMANNFTINVTKYSASSEIIANVPVYTSGMGVGYPAGQASTSGAPRVGYKVSAVDGAWVSTPAPSFVYQWFVCTNQRTLADKSLGSDCRDINGASTKEFSITPELATDYNLVGKFLGVMVTGSNKAGQDFAYSTTSTKAVTMPPQLEVSPEISGYRYVDGTLTGTKATFTGTAPITITQSWWQCAAAIETAVTVQPAGCVSVTGTASTLKLTLAMKGKFVTTATTGVNDAGTLTVWAPSTVEVTTGAINVVPPTIAVTPTGLPKVGGTLTANHGVWSGDPALTESDYTYQWYSCAIEIKAASFTLDPLAECIRVGDAVNTTYEPVRDDAGRYVLVSVTGTNSQGGSKIFSTSTTKINMAPEIMVAPVLSGTAFVGTDQTTTTGTWLGVPDPTFTYQWLLCSTPQTIAPLQQPADCDAIESATASTYQPIIDYVGSYLMIRVSAKNVAGTSLAYSITSDEIKSAPRNVTAPTVTVTNGTDGLPVANQSELSTTGGLWQGRPTPTYKFQWFSCAVAMIAGASEPAADKDCKPVTEVVKDIKYQPVASDRGRFVAVKVYATNEWATVTHWSATSTVINMAPVADVSPIVDGVPFVQGTVVAKADTWTAFPAPTRTYQWMSCGELTLPSACNAIAGASAASFSIPASLENYSLMIKVTARNAFGSAVSYSPASSTITTGPVSTATQVITGSVAYPPVAGAVLSTNEGTWAGDPRPTLTYQWYRCSQVVATSPYELNSKCSAIEGETSNTYSLTDADPSSAIMVGIKGENVWGTSTRYSASTAIVTEKVRLITSPSLIGTARIGEEITGDEGVWRGFPKPDTVYSWYTCTVATPAAPVRIAAASGVGVVPPAACTKIQGASRATFAVSETHLGKMLIFMVTKSNTVNGTLTTVNAYSQSSLPAAQPPVALAKPGISSAGTVSNANPKVGSIWTVSTGIWADPQPVKTYQWYRCDTRVATGTTPITTLPSPSCLAISGATGTSYTITAEDSGKFISIEAIASNAADTIRQWSNSTLSVLQVPIAITPPTISGERQRSKVLTIDQGIWTGSPIPVISYQWYSCKTAIETTSTTPQPATNCSQISGETSATYTQSPAGSDDGKFITATVSGTSGTAEPTVYWVTVAAGNATALAPAAQALPSIYSKSGKSAVGEVFSIEDDRWVGAPAPVLTYKWYACNTANIPAASTLAAGCSEIVGQTGQTYVATVELADLRKYLMGSVTATNFVGSATTYSKSYETLIDKGIINTRPASITAASAVVPTTVAWTAGEWTSSYELRITQKWLYCSTALTTVYSYIPFECDFVFPSTTNAAAGPLSITAAMELSGQYIALYEKVEEKIGTTWAKKRERVTATTAQLVEAPSLRNADVGFVAPSVSKDMVVGYPTTAAAGTWVAALAGQTSVTWRGSKVGTFSYQWFTCPTAQASYTTTQLPSGCTNLVASPGRSTTTESFTPTEAEIGSYLGVRIRATNATGSFDVWTATSLAVTQEATNVSPPALGPQSIVDERITLTGGLVADWKGSPTPTVTVEWFTCTKQFLTPPTTLQPECTSVLKSQGPNDNGLDLVVGYSTGTKYIMAKVTATNKPWVFENRTKTVELFTATSKRIVARPYLSSLATAPIRSGVDDVGEALALSTGSWLGTTPMTLTGRWFACDTPVATSTLESVAPGCTLFKTGSQGALLAHAQAGKYIVGQIEASNQAGKTWQSTTAGVKVLEAPTIVSPPEVKLIGSPLPSGRLEVGQSLEQVVPVWDGLPTPTPSLKFYECTNAVPAATTTIPVDCTPSIGVTGTQMLLSEAQAGKHIIAVGTATNTVNKSTVPRTTVSVSASLGPIYRTPYFEATSTPTISAPQPHVGSTFFFTKSLVKGFETPTTTYSWYICTSQILTPAIDSVPAGCSIVAGADNAALKTPLAAAGKYILGIQTASASWTPVIARKSSISSEQVTASPYVVTPPTTSGDDYVGGTVKVSVQKGTWSSFPAIADDSKYSIAILQCDNPNIAGATPTGCLATPLATFTASSPSEYAPTSTQAGKYLVARVTATAATKLSATDSVSYHAASFGPIREAASLPGQPSIVGADLPNVGKTLTMTTTTPKGYPVNTPTYDWYVCDTAIASVPASVPADCALQAAASSKSLVIPASAAGKYLLGWITASNALGSVSKATAFSQMVKMAPVNVSEPILSGLDEVGGTITATTGDWTSTPAPTFAYQWYSCQAASSTIANNGCTAISGATVSPNFTPTEVQASKYILVNVTATTAIWGSSPSATKASSTFGPIRMPAEFKSVPNVSGTPHVDETLALSFSAGSIVGFPIPTYSYDWYACDSAVVALLNAVPADCVLIPGSTRLPLKLTSAQAGKHVMAFITASNYSSVSRTTKSTLPISETLVNVIAPALSGDVFVGGTAITSSAGTWSSTPAVNPASNVTYAFFACDTATWVANCSALITANNKVSTVTLTAALQGKYVVARVTANVAVNKQPLGTLTVTTNAIGPVETAPTFTATPTTSGVSTMHVGAIVSAISTGELGVPAPTKTFNWFFCNTPVTASAASMPADCTAADPLINGNSTITLPSAAGGKYVSVLVTLQNGRGSVSASTLASTLVTATPVSVSAPAIGGDDIFATGKNVTVSTGTWVTAPVAATKTFTYAWYACPTAASQIANCAYLGDTSAGTIATSEAMVDKFVLAKVTVSVAVNKSGAGTAFAYSNVSNRIRKSAVFASNPVVSGYMHVGETLTAGTGNPSGVPSPSVSYEWYVCSSAVLATVTAKPATCVLDASSTSNTYVIPNTAAGSFIMTIAKASSDSDLAVAYRSSTTNVAVSSPAVIGATKPAITGTPILGSAPLSVSTGAWVWKPSTATAAYSYRWFACSSTAVFTGGTLPPEGCNLIANQTASTLTLTTAELGFKVIAEVTVSVATNQPAPSKSSYFTAVSNVVMSKPAPGATPPSIGYTALTAGSILKANLGTWSGSPAPTLTYTWYTCPANTVQPTNKLAPATCTALTVKGDLTVIAAYKGLKLLLLVLASTDGVGTATNVSALVMIP